MKKVVFALLISSVVGGGAGALVAYKLSSPKEIKVETITRYDSSAPAHFTSYTKEGYPDLTYAAENAVPAVVSIESRRTVSAQEQYDYGGGDIFDWFFGIPGQQRQQRQQPRQVRAGGSGVMISPDGYIVTNNHVIEDFTELIVTLYDKRVYKAELVGTDPQTDIALLKIDAQEMPFLPLGSSENLRLGEWVLAIGSPLGLEHTVTAGIVSSKGRSLNFSNSGRIDVSSFIQTDAAVNSGNSGGPLVNTAGEVVGINTIIKSETGSFIGYSFAVPSSIVRKVVSDLREYGIAQRPYIGIAMQEISQAFVEELGEEFGIKEVGEGGVMVVEIQPGSAAEAAGMEKGDIIHEIDGVKMSTSSQVQEYVVQRHPGDKIIISVKRGNKTKQFEVVLRNRAGGEELLTKATPNLAKDLGGQFRELSDKKKRELRVEYGIEVTKVDPNGILAKMSVKPGYIITDINDRPIKNTGDLGKVTGEIESIDVIRADGRSVRYQQMKKE